MSWNTENTDPIGDLTRMKEAIESAPMQRIYVNPIDMLNFEQTGIIEEKAFMVVDNDVPLGYIMVNNTLIEADRVISMFRPYKTPSICYELGKQKDLPQPQPRNRAERRKAMKRRKRGNHHGNI